MGWVPRSTRRDELQSMTTLSLDIYLDVLPLKLTGAQRQKEIKPVIIIKIGPRTSFSWISLMPVSPSLYYASIHVHIRTWVQIQSFKVILQDCITKTGLFYQQGKYILNTIMVHSDHWQGLLRDNERSPEQLCSCSSSKLPCTVLYRLL
jgi:hypothetical protein